MKTKYTISTILYFIGIIAIFLFVNDIISKKSNKLYPFYNEYSENRKKTVLDSLRRWNGYRPEFYYAYYYYDKVFLRSTSSYFPPEEVGKHLVDIDSFGINALNECERVSLVSPYCGIAYIDGPDWIMGSSDENFRIIKLEPILIAELKNTNNEDSQLLKIDNAENALINSIKNFRLDFKGDATQGRRDYNPSIGHFISRLEEFVQTRGLDNGWTDPNNQKHQKRPINDYWYIEIFFDSIVSGYREGYNRYYYGYDTFGKYRVFYKQQTDSYLIKKKENAELKDKIIYWTILFFLLTSLFLSYIITSKIIDKRRKHIFEESLYEKLKRICNPENFKNDIEHAIKASNIYEKILKTSPEDTTALTQIENEVLLNLGVPIIDKYSISELKKITNPRKYTKPFNSEKVRIAHDLYRLLSKEHISYSEFLYIKNAAKELSKKS